MIKIKISTTGGGKPFIKQLKSFNPTWGNCEFFINGEIPECDVWVIYGGLEKEESVLCPKDGTLFVTNEPPSVKKYSKKFTDQFSAIMTCHKNLKHQNKIYNQQAMPWWLGYKMQSGENKYYKTYDELKNMDTPEKTCLASIIVSNKIFTKEHKQRYDFFKKLKKELGSEIDIFGIGSNIVDDKWDAIASYKYHIVLENASLDNWWTEKLSDAFLAESYPIYYGCTNIYDYFPKNSLTQIDINKPNEAIEIIKKIIHGNQYEKSIEDIRKAKHLILDKYQIFPMLTEYANAHISNKEKILMNLKPEEENGLKIFFKKIIKKIIK